MLSRDDYLRLGATDARRQWQAILGRARMAPGQRQVNFTPVETLLCLAASLLVDHRRYGGGTSHRAAEPVPTLARLFRRPNSSVLAKMANLDGSRRNGARHEVEIAAELLSQPGALAAAYRLVIQAARDLSVERSDLPDFLALEDADTDLSLLGQEELDESSIETSLQDELSIWFRQRSDLEEQVTQRLLVAAVRVGQHRFASEVLRNHRHSCLFCGLNGHFGGVRARRMLVASHIKPWRVCTATERLDPRNGLTACPTHDVAFDSGLLAVNGGLRIHLAPQVKLATRRDPAARAAFGRPPLAERLLLPAGSPPPRGSYLEWHRTNVFDDGTVKGPDP